MRPVRPRAAGPRRVHLLLVHPYGSGGVPRAMLMLAGGLAERGYDVEVMGVLRRHDAPAYPVDPRVRLTFLLDRSPSSARPEDAASQDRAPTSLAGADGHAVLDARTEELLRRRLVDLPAGSAVVSTRPELASAIARWAPPDVLRVNQEHLAHSARPDGLRQALVDAAPHLDALVTLTDADRDAWSADLGPRAPRLAVVPNAGSFEVAADLPALTSTTVVAAGRLTPQKGFDRLVEAWTPIARSRPGWQLHIYGAGPSRGRLDRLVARRRLGDSVHLRGHTDRLREVLRDASVYVMSSRYEGLPMVLIEAMSQGLPPVSFDCPEGPRQLIDDGDNGLLVPDGDVPGLTVALLRLIDDPAERRRLAAAALKRAESYTLDHVLDAWEQLFSSIDPSWQGSSGEGAS